MKKSQTIHARGREPGWLPDRFSQARGAQDPCFFDSQGGASKFLQEESWKSSTGKLLEEEFWKKEWEVKTVTRLSDARPDAMPRAADALPGGLPAANFVGRRMWVRAQSQAESTLRQPFIPKPPGHPFQATPSSWPAADEAAAEWVESHLQEAWAIRELMATLMEQDWLGLQCLAQLRVCPHMSAADIGAAVNRSPDALSPTLARLEQHGAVAARVSLFVCTDRGLELLKNLEAAAGVELVP